MLLTNKIVRKMVLFWRKKYPPKLPPSTTSFKPAQAQISKLEQESKDKFHTQEIKDFDAAHSKFNEPNHSLTHTHTLSLSNLALPL